MNLDERTPAVQDVLVFRTNIQKKAEFAIIEKELQKLAGIQKCTVDFEDREKVLRIECLNPNLMEIVDTVNRQGFICEELED